MLPAYQPQRGWYARLDPIEAIDGAAVVQVFAGIWFALNSALRSSGVLDEPGGFRRRGNS